MTATTGVLRSVHDRLDRLVDAGTASTDRVTVGDNHLLVEVSRATAGPTAGAAHRPDGDLDATPAGRDALEVARWAFEAPTPGSDLARAIGIATMNALSAPCIEWRTGDPMAALDAAVERVATVGLFGPAFKKFGDVHVRVIERDPDVTLPPAADDVPVSVFSPDAAEEAIPGVDVLFVTGSSLIYGGTTRYLRLAREAGVDSVVLIGATASFLPAPAFEAGATILAGARVADVESVRRGIERGDCGTDLHDAGLEKVFVTADERAHGLALDRLRQDG